MDEEIVVTSVGQPYEAGPNYRDRPMPEFVGQHLWIVTGVWRIETPEADHILDAENLLTVAGPGCWFCGELYSPEAADLPCAGVSDE